MNNSPVFICICLLGMSLSLPTRAQKFDSHIPMQRSQADTYYVDVQIDGFGDANFMVDTGSGYTVINQQTLSKLLQENNATYIKELTGILADGGEMNVPVYTISQLNIGGNCRLQNIQVAVFPGSTRQILGLSTLEQASPFIFSTDPPMLVLSHCQKTKMLR